MNSIYLFGINDLRLENNFVLSQAIKNSNKVIPVFIFDEEIFENDNINNNKKIFIYNAVKLIQNELKNFNSKLIIRYGKFLTELLNILNETKINNIYLNENTKNNDITFLSEEYNYKLFVYSDFKKLKRVKKQKFEKYKENFSKNYILNYEYYKISKLNHNIDIFSENIDNFKFNKFKNNKIILSSYKYIKNKVKIIDVDNFEDLILYLDFGLISPSEVLENTKIDSNFESQIIFEHICFNEYKKLFNNIRFEEKHSENFETFVSIINCNTGNNLINAISKAILSKRVISSYHLKIFVNFAISKNISILWIKNFLKNELINFDNNLFNAVVYNKIKINKLNNDIYNLKNLGFIKKYIKYNNLPDFLYLNPYYTPVSIQKTIGYRIGKDFPEEKIKEETYYLT